MTTPNKFYQFVEDLGKGVHVLGAHQLKVALTNTLPVASNSVYANLTSPLSSANLSGATPFNITTTSYTQTLGVAPLVLADLTLTATGSVGPFQYVVIYNDTPTSPADPLICWINYPSSITMAASETFLIDLTVTQTLFTVT